MKFLFRVAVVFLFSSTIMRSSVGQNIKSIGWLAGDWIMKSENSTTTESWTMRNDSTIIGSSMTVSNEGELLFEEALNIATRGKETSYIALLPNKTARFKTQLLSKSSAIFIDTNNDFPSKITYLKTKTGIQVVLEGKGNKRVMNFVKNAY